MEQQSQFDSFEMQVSLTAQNFLKTASGWAMFLSIVGFIGCGFGLLGSLGAMAAGGMMGDTPGGMGMMGMMGGMTMGIMLLVFTLIMFVPVLYLFKFASKTKQAINNNSTDEITQAFGNLRSYFVWAGVLTILYIVGYTIFIVAFASAAASMGAGM